MNNPTLNRIESVLDRHFANLIDLSDFTKHSDALRRQCRLSRSLAALAIKSLNFSDPETAARSVVDGFDDNGIDAIHFDVPSDTLYIVQSKWQENSDKPVDPDGIRRFATGIRDILSCRFERFNDRVRAKQADIRAALHCERPIRTRLIFIHTATIDTPPHALRELEDLVEELNIPVKSFFLDIYDQQGVYRLITAESEPTKIRLQVGLSDWGSIEHPFLAYYGRVHVNEIKQWWRDFSHNLFTHNLRLYNPRTDVNEAVRNTLSTDPAFFWYFNNGITVICDKVTKGAAGSPARAIGIFTCEGASIVNGAQTVGTIGDFDQLPNPHEQPIDAWVLVRIISLEKAPPEFGRRITRAANLQNAVSNREFAAMDPLQHQISADFALDQRRYVYKSGEADSKGEEGCSIIEATQALACKVSVNLAVQVKREINLMWADTTAPPYTDIFNARLSSTELWRAVQILRAVDDELQRCKRIEIPRADMIATHMNRIILHLVFQDPSVRSLDRDGSSIESLLSAAKMAVEPAFIKVAQYLESVFPTDYLASLCKNLGKCQDVVDSVYKKPKVLPLAPMPTKQGSLFAE